MPFKNINTLSCHYQCNLSHINSNISGVILLFCEHISSLQLVIEILLKVCIEPTPCACLMGIKKKKKHFFVAKIYRNQSPKQSSKAFKNALPSYIKCEKREGERKISPVMRQPNENDFKWSNRRCGALCVWGPKAAAQVDPCQHVLFYFHTTRDRF